MGRLAETRSWTAAAQAVVSPDLVDSWGVARNCQCLDSVLARVPQYRGSMESPEPEPQAGIPIHLSLPNPSGSEAAAKGPARCCQVQLSWSGWWTVHPGRAAYFHFRQPADLDCTRPSKADSTKCYNHNRQDPGEGSARIEAACGTSHRSVNDSNLSDREADEQQGGQSAAEAVRQRPVPSETGQAFHRPLVTVCSEQPLLAATVLFVTCKTVRLDFWMS
jgi:hypothetical protein